MYIARVRTYKEAVVAYSEILFQYSSDQTPETTDKLSHASVFLQRLTVRQKLSAFMEPEF
jgi:hypothetical protein